MVPEEPLDLEEEARVDGASRFARISLPLVAPG
jgi:ABC-type glycerol-3-phosphate transport system permease component